MKKINWRVRLSNPQFIAQIAMSILMPILAYAGLTMEDLTTWQALGELFVNAIRNPYCLGLAVVSCYNAIVDNTTFGIFDDEVTLQKSNVKENK